MLEAWSRTRDGTRKLSANFTVAEFACTTSERFDMPWLISEIESFCSFEAAFISFIACAFCPAISFTEASTSLVCAAISVPAFRAPHCT